jgi:hypothetical protein
MGGEKCPYYVIVILIFLYNADIPVKVRGIVAKYR